MTTDIKTLDEIYPPDPKEDFGVDPSDPYTLLTVPTETATLIEDLLAAAPKGPRPPRKFSLHRAMVLGLVPRQLGPTICPSLVVPAPPRLSAFMSLQAQEDLVRTQFNNMCKARGWGTLRVAPSNFKHRGAIKSCIKDFKVHDISPAAWFGWYSDVWMRCTPDRPPPFYWLFNRITIAKQLHWFKSAAMWYRVPRIVQGPKRLKLSETWYAMEIALRTEDPGTDDEIRAVVDRFFPTGYDRHLQGVIKETMKLQAQIDARRDSGEWLWEHVPWEF
jgi:hypothetical protein